MNPYDDLHLDDYGLDSYYADRANYKSHYSDEHLDDELDDLLAPREVKPLSKPRQPATPVASGSLNPTALQSKICSNFISALELRDGGCFRTEIRDSGVFICGIHKDAVWSKEDQCPYMDALLVILEGAVEKAVADELRADTLPLKPQGISKPKPSRSQESMADVMRNILDKPWGSV